MTSLLLLDNFDPVISYRRVRKKLKATNYRERFGRSLWSANQPPAQVVKLTSWSLGPANHLELTINLQQVHHFESVCARSGGNNVGGGGG